MTRSGPANTAEEPWSVRVVSSKIREYIDRMGQIWIEGQITQLNVRKGTRTAFVTLRDPSADMSLSLTCAPSLLTNPAVPVQEGARVVVLGKPTFFTGRGSFSMRVTEIRAVGIGELLARIERLRQALAAEGLFDPRLKRPLPYLPRRIGLITGRASAAERDVIEVARSRWSRVEFEIRNTPVQGASAVPAILDALAELDADPRVDVIILARGGGSVEDLLPFSDETLCRAISRCTTPVVSAIGHEPDSPLSDHVADLRAATPTDAAKRVVPDEALERSRIAEMRDRSAGALRNWVARELRGLEAMRSRPVLADPLLAITRRGDEIDRARNSARREIRHHVSAQRTEIGALTSRLETLGPAATMARGYAVVQRIVPGADAEVVHSVEEAPPGTQLRVRLIDGALSAAVMGATRLAPRGHDDDH